MTEWFYRATPTKVSFEETRDLMVSDGFVCRSAYEENGSRADNTRRVRFGDILHAYFTGEGDPKIIGSFEIVGPNRHPKGSRFKKGVSGTALFEVDDDFGRTLLALGEEGGQRYLPDPILKRLTGWAVLPRTDVTTPPFSEAPFKGRAVLVTFPSSQRR